MPREALTRSLGEGLEVSQVVLGGSDGDVPHVDRERGQVRLHVYPGAVPAEQRRVGEGVAQVVDAREGARRRPHARLPEELPESIGEPFAR